MSAPRVVLLGPQRHRPTLARTVDELGLRGRLAVVTAGWEEREEEDDELAEHLGGRTLNLQLFRRAERAFERDPELFGALRERHDRARAAQALYRVRLGRALESARELLAGAPTEPGLEDLWEAERADAVEAVRALDRRHAELVGESWWTFFERWRPLERAAVAAERGELARLLEDCEVVCIAGGHVGILANRLRIFDLPGLVGGRTVIAWSAGAMALAERIVLFHDSPPQGPGDAEVFEPGRALAPGVLPLPHAQSRLRLDDAVRVGLLARRFGPDLCVPFDEGARLDWDGERWRAAPGTERLCADGSLAPATPEAAAAAGGVS